MALIEHWPEHLAPDPCRKDTLTFRSAADGKEQIADIYSPASEISAPLPLLLAPHPITWTAEQDYHGGYEGFTREYHRGYYALADRYSVIIAMPHGHHRREETCSLASPEQISDLVQIIDDLESFGYRVNKQQVYICGLSMGAQEALVAAGRFPDRFTAVCVFNPIVDLAAWQEDLANMDLPEVKEFDTARRIANEVGGLPSEAPGAYAERSPLNYLDGLVRVPTLIFWSDQDLIVPRQITHHGYFLYQKLKAKDVSCPVSEYNHTLSHGVTMFDQRTRFQLHEWADYELALRWLLIHRKPKNDR
jgi:pimeloyl-ACP methyl ester carboxylesterase